jgi:hypothetical protein
MQSLFKSNYFLIFETDFYGEVQEWLNWLPWKGSVLARVPWVRIPLSPHRKIEVRT